MNDQNDREDSLGIQQIVQSLAALIAAAYVAGWAFYLAYFMTFGSLWLLPHVSTVSLLRGSAAPLIVLSLLLAFVAADIRHFATTAKPAQARLMSVAFDRKYRVGSTLFLMLLSGGCIVIGAVINTAVAAGVLLTLAAMIGSLLAIENALRSEAPRYSRLRSAMSVLIVSIVLLPSGIGFVSAGILRAADLQTLPRVYEKSPTGNASSTMVGRLLLSTDQRVFVARRVGGDVYISPISWDNVEKIVR